MLATDMIATQISGDQINRMLALKNGDDNDPWYIEQVAFFQKLRANSTDICNFYIMKKVDDKIYFILDDAEDGPCKINEEYTDYDPELMKAFAGKTTASTDFYTDEWGTYLSGYTPIYDAQGKLLAVFGADMDVKKAVEKQDFIGSLIYLVMGLAILAAALIIFFFSTTIIRDINALTNIAQKLSAGELDFELPNIKAKNEIGLLNKAMMSVLAAVEFLREIVDENTEQPEEGSSSEKEGENHGC
jgi:methyl-accepting chemotaxis protein